MENCAKHLYICASSAAHQRATRTRGSSRSFCMKRAKRLLVIGSDSHYGSGVAEGIYRYCRENGNWEYHLERDSSAESAQRSRFAIREWKADGSGGCSQ